MGLNFQKLKDAVKKDRATKDMLENQNKDLSLKQDLLIQTISDAEKARVILQEVAQKTLQNLEFHISNLGTLALKSVSPDFPELSATITIRRNQTEVDFLFKEFGKEQKPLDSSGFGAVNVVCYALRVSFWSLNKNRNVMILDEPFRDLSPDLQHKASEMVKRIGQKYNMQHIIVSHSENLNFAADRTFIVTKTNKKSKVEVLE